MIKTSNSTDGNFNPPSKPKFQILELEGEIFKTIIAFALTISTFSIILNFYLESDPVIKLINSFLLLILLVGYNISSNPSLYTKSIFGLSIFIFFAFSSLVLYSGSFSETLAFYFLIYVFSYSILLRPKETKSLYVFIVVLFALLAYNNPLLISFTGQNPFGSVNLLPLFLAVTFISYASFTLRKIYDKSNQTISSKNEELEHKNLLIRRKNVELVRKTAVIELMNMQLNKLVAERTQKINLQNEQLKEYAFFNSHKVRGPLARVMGLTELLSICEEHEKELYIEKLKQSSKELDEVVSEINKILVDA